MEAGILQFDPASEFEIIETIDFSEEIQRPEQLRFFTLDEQLDDYFDKVLPKKKKVTKFELKNIADEVDRIRELYEDVITTTDIGYTSDITRRDVHVSWVAPIYSDFEYKAFSFSESWIPLYTPERRRIPNYYPQMLAALPKPYRTTESGGVGILETTQAVDSEGKNPIHVMSTYERTKGVVHDDGSFSVVSLPMANTADDIKRKGFYIFPRGSEIPNPLDNHPFLSSNTPSALETTEPLNDVFPTIEAILTHGVPKTNDPYVEGQKFLKLYDVRLSRVPWNLWKDQFPPVNTILAYPQVLSVKFPDVEDEPQPSKSLQQFYVVPWKEGLNPRFWLTQQVDAGNVVIKLLLSKAGEAGNVPPRILGDVATPVFPKSTPEECFTVESGFDAFLNSGIYRGGVCVPTSAIAQERQDLLSNKRVGWMETTSTELLKEYKELLSYFQAPLEKQSEVKYEKYAGKPLSELRKDVVVILDDPTRMASDKADDITLLLRETDLKNELYLDKSDSFVICGHTLSVLKGDLITDRIAFYDRWTAIEEGYRVCKYCGELVNTDVLVAQDDFDENGNVLVNYDTLSSGVTFQGDVHVEAFTNSLNEMRTVFDLGNPGESILYLLLSLMQVLPDQAQLLPVIMFIRKLSAVIRMNKKIEKLAKDRVEGILGIVGMVVLLQTHNPFLVPRRSFGSRVLKLTGFPRDTDDMADAPTLDILINVLRTTFQASPNTFKGPVTPLLRKIISAPREVRKETGIFLKQASVDFKTQFASAKERYVAPTPTDGFIQISLPILTVPKSSFTPSESRVTIEKLSECVASGPKQFLSGKLPPNVSQEAVKLYPTVVSKSAELVEGELQLVPPVTFSDAEIRKRVGLGFPKGIKIPKLEEFLKSNTDGIAFLTLMNRVLDILSREKYPLDVLRNYRLLSIHLQTRIQASLLRDAARGLVYELLHDVAKKTGFSQALLTASQKDLVMSMILLTEEQASKQDRDLRARERETFKMRMRQMNDTEREVTKMLLDIGIAGYIITNEDREIFAKEYRLPDPESDYEKAQQEQDLDRPEEGYNAERDIEDDQNPIMNNGVELEADRGDYTDRREEPYGRDYNNFGDFDFDEGFGV